MQSALPSHDLPAAPPGGLSIAVVGAGPSGLALALLAAQRLPQARITVFDARPADKDVHADARTLALALGSVQLLQRLGAWPAEAAEAIREVHVSQAPPTLALPVASSPDGAQVRIRALDEGVPLLGAVLAYGPLVVALQAAWERAVAAAPQRLALRLGAPVAALKPCGDGVEVDAGVAEVFDLAVVAEGGVFSEQSRKAVVHDYRQTAWVGTALLEGATPGLAVERFTRQGPVALLPLPRAADTPDSAQRRALVWCVDSDDDPVAGLTDAQRVVVLQSLLPEVAGRVRSLSPLKHFALGLNAERTLVEGRVVRIGNAAQTLHPVAGQGLNLGLRDAYALVQALSDVPPGADVANTLRRIGWQRAPDRWAMIAATDFLARSFTWHWPGLPAARGLGLALVQAVGPLKSALARQMMFGRR